MQTMTAHIFAVMIDTARGNERTELCLSLKGERAAGDDLWTVTGVTPDDAENDRPTPPDYSEQGEWQGVLAIALDTALNAQRRAEGALVDGGHYVTYLPGTD